VNAAFDLERRENCIAPGRVRTRIVQQMANPKSGEKSASGARSTSGAPSASGDQPATARLPASTQENLELLTRFKDGEEAKISGLQNLIERISRFFGSPAYFAFSVVFIVLWIAVNSFGVHAHWQHVDAPPFSWLQGLVSSNALLLTVAVLIRQNRMAQVAEHRAHLDLQINLLTEQKVTKILQIIDELRPNLPAQRAGSDDEVTEMSKPADAHTLMHAIKEKQEDR
jgi:uncharacterized membrane protein